MTGGPQAFNIQRVPAPMPASGARKPRGDDAVSLASHTHALDGRHGRRQNVSPRQSGKGRCGSLPSPVHDRLVDHGYPEGVDDQQEQDERHNHLW